MYPLYWVSSKGGTYHEPSPPFAIVLSNLWIAYGFIQTVLERRPGDVHRLVRVVIEFQQVREQKGLCYSIYSYGTCHDNTGYFGVYTALGRGEVLDEDAIIAARPALWGGRLFCSHPAFPWGKVPRRGG